MIQKRMRQVVKFLKSFFLYRFLWGKKFGYKHDPKAIDVGWNKVQTYGVFQCPVKFLQASIPTTTGQKLVPIEQTLHYQYIQSLIKGENGQSIRDMYRQYVEKFYPSRNPEDKLNETAKLIKSIVFESGFDPSKSIVTYPPKFNWGSGVYEVRIYDGLHRAAIAKELGYNFIQCRLR